jgi:hypothetical protein
MIRLHFEPKLITNITTHHHHSKVDLAVQASPCVRCPQDSFKNVTGDGPCVAVKHKGWASSPLRDREVVRSIQHTQHQGQHQQAAGLSSSSSMPAGSSTSGEKATTTTTGGMSPAFKALWEKLVPEVFGFSASEFDEAFMSSPLSSLSASYLASSPPVQYNPHAWTAVLANEEGNEAGPGKNR